MKDMGVLMGKGGLHGNVFRIKPPMCFNRDDADFLVDVMDVAMSELAILAPTRRLGVVITYMVTLLVCCDFVSLSLRSVKAYSLVFWQCSASDHAFALDVIVCVLPSTSVQSVSTYLRASNYPAQAPPKVLGKGNKRYADSGTLAKL
eukprot:scaffold148453_cov55-Prasinocladus_malaysianus.AAC.1